MFLWHCVQYFNFFSVFHFGYFLLTYLWVHWSFFCFNLHFSLFITFFVSDTYFHSRISLWVFFRDLVPLMKFLSVCSSCPSLIYLTKFFNNVLKIVIYRPPLLIIVSDHQWICLSWLFPFLSLFLSFFFFSFLFFCDFRSHF